MIIDSLLDTDLYKFTMMQVVLHHFPTAQVEYRFKCRTPGVDLTPYIGEIEREISEDVLLNTLWIDPDSVSFVVIDGKVTIAGEAENRTDAELIDEHIRRVPGVTSVCSELRWQIDDRARRTLASAVRGTRRI